MLDEVARMETYKDLVVGCAEGIHARPAACLVRLANGYPGEIAIHYDNNVIDAKSIMSILAAGIGFGAKIKVVVSGDSADSVLDQIEDLLVAGKIA
jgi:phosphotransferase system HPr (HPr) family protein